MLSVLSLLLALAIHAQAATYSLHHRIVHPKHTPNDFRARGTLDISASNARFESASTVSEDLALFEHQLNSARDTTGALYQIALQKSDSESQSEWAVSSVKLCHLAAATTQTLFLYLSEDDTPYSLDYFVSPIPHDGACPRQRRQSPWPKNSDTPPPLISPLRDFSDHLDHLNTTIHLRKLSSAPSPELKAPPPLTPEGQVVQPVPEKSFLQKYWMYIGIFLFAILLTSGEPESPGKGAPAAGPK